MTIDLSRERIWILGTEVTSDTKGEKEGSKIDMNQIPKTFEYSNDDTEDIREEKATTEEAHDLNIMTTLEVESYGSKAKSNITNIEQDKVINNLERSNGTIEHAVIIRHDNLESNAIASNNEIASNIDIANKHDSGEVDDYEEKPEEKSSSFLIANHGKDETEDHLRDAFKKKNRNMRHCPILA